MSGAIAGSYLSASASGSLDSVVGVTPMQAFVGGALMFMGARIAGGCTRCVFCRGFVLTRFNKMFGLHTESFI